MGRKLYRAKLSFRRKIGGGGCECTHEVEVIGIQLIRNFQSTFVSSFVQWGIWDQVGAIDGEIENSSDIMSQFALENRLTFSWGQHISAALRLGFKEVYPYILDREPSPSEFNIFYIIFAKLKIEILEYYQSYFYNSRLTEQEYLFLKSNSRLRNRHYPHIQLMINQYREKWQLPSTPLPVSVSKELTDFLSRTYEDELKDIKEHLKAIKIQQQDFIESISNFKEIKIDNKYFTSKASYEFLEKIAQGSLLELYEVKVSLESSNASLARSNAELERKKDEISSIFNSRSYKYAKKLSVFLKNFRP